MGKYMRSKSKNTGEVSLMDVPSSLGVRTRARTLALQKAAAANSSSYIQLRSRRLVKPNPPSHPKRQRESCCFSSNPGGNDSSKGGANVNSSRLNVNRQQEDSGSMLKVNREEEDSGSVKCSPTDNNLVDNEEEIHQDGAIREGVHLGIDEEACFGDNMLEIEGRERSTRETTPCSLIRDPGTIRTPGSSTKPPSSTDGNFRVGNSTPRHIPSTVEMDEFFTGPEKQQQRLFIEKYNFDPVSDKPLPGRYEWVEVDDTKKS